MHTQENTVTEYAQRIITQVRSVVVGKDRELMWVLAAIMACPVAEKLTVLEENAGLHFLVKVNTQESDAALVERCRRGDIHVRSLGSYYRGEVPVWAEQCLVVNYSGISEEQLALLEERLGQIL